MNILVASLAQGDAIRYFIPASNVSGPLPNMVRMDSSSRSTVLTSKMVSGEYRFSPLLIDIAIPFAILVWLSLSAISAVFAAKLNTQMAAWRTETFVAPNANQNLSQGLFPTIEMGAFDGAYKIPCVFGTAPEKNLTANRTSGLATGLAVNTFGITNSENRTALLACSVQNKYRHTWIMPTTV